ncbi:MAG: NAD(P)H-dependent glycerol-3-phosphate dehydrogenase [Deltaproteobacteria bacterium]|jgi:glycerol-3-phosphate dehydrogenase (NAD(P)+)|nr:NAD(P)H-dependent glycerol-3-phosphate dehydrogenase [Deltaproteobacteria bacterium]
MKLRVSVLGAGSFGTTMAHLLSHNAPTLLWCRRPETADEINHEHRNERYLPGYGVAEEVRATPSLEEAVREADVLVMGIPSHGFRAALEEVAKHIRPWVPVVSLAKGIEPGTYLRMTEVIREVLPEHRAGALSGPNLAREIMAGFAAASVIAFEDVDLGRQLQGLFQCGVFRVYTNNDVVGCELGGALKNVIAIATGMGDGLGVGDNTRSTVITRGLAELTHLGVAMGGQPATFAGLAGIGDLVATCTSQKSRNRHVGERLGRGETIDEITATMSMVAEGVKTSAVTMELAERFSIEMPIAREVYGVLYEGRTAEDAYRGLTRRTPGAEHEPD